MALACSVSPLHLESMAECVDYRSDAAHVVLKSLFQRLALPSAFCEAASELSWARLRKQRSATWTLVRSQTNRAGKAYELSKQTSERQQASDVKRC